MRRWTVRVLVCLVLGAAANVAVAWTLALTIDFVEGDRYEEGYDLTPPMRFGARRASKTGALWAMSYRMESPSGAKPPFLEGPYPTELLPAWSGLAQPEFKTDSRMGRWDTRWVFANGWPCYSMWYEVSRADLLGTMTIEGGLEVGRWPDSIIFGEGPRGLPLRPVPVGFLIDTLFYAAIWFVLFFGPGTARRIVRRHRGRCPSCGYDLQGALDTGCPECGWGREAGAES